MENKSKTNGHWLSDGVTFKYRNSLWVFRDYVDETGSPMMYVVQKIDKCSCGLENTIVWNVDDVDNRILTIYTSFDGIIAYSRIDLKDSVLINTTDNDSKQ